MKIRQICTFLFSSAFLLVFHHPLQAQIDQKTRIIILTDIENEPDDAQSLVRFLTYANQFEIEGIIATTSIWMQNEVADWRIREIIDSYEKVRTNLEKHEKGYPSADLLRAKTKRGLSVFGMEGVGEGHDSEGSEWIIDVVDKEDSSPVWISVWGGSNCLAQALWKVSYTRTAEELATFISKIRVYTISDQDDSGPWIRKSFPELFYICSPGYEENGGGGYHHATWSGISGDQFHGRFIGADFSIVDNPWLDRHVRKGHGPLGSEYPQTEYLMEGDTPSYLYLVDNGLNSPENPDFGGWGGRYELQTPPTKPWFYYPESRPFWSNTQDEVWSPYTNAFHTSHHATIWRWREAYQNDFAARMDWCVRAYGEANHPPYSTHDQIQTIQANAGSQIQLEAEGWHDPDRDSLSYEWFYYKEAGGSDQRLQIKDSQTTKATVLIPDISGSQDFHIMLAVTDNGSPRLTRYQRFIIKADRTEHKPEVFIFTDINLSGGDPDDRQSLLHLLWYADELTIKGIVPDSWDRRGVEASRMGLEAYGEDFHQYGFDQKGYPPVEQLEHALVKSPAEVASRFKESALSSEGPLYVLVWGNMASLRDVLFTHPELSDRIRIISIGTGLKYGPKDEVAGEECDIPNWNGAGRNDLFDDPRFDNMWWLEINWTYNGMFEGTGPNEMFEELSQFGAMGRQIKSVTSNHDWAQYFRVGDTPSVLYVIDPTHDVNKPEINNWAGTFKKAFPIKRPNYYTDHNGPVEWDYSNPCKTWHNLKSMYKYNKSTLLKKRQEMYDALLQKLSQLYETH